MQKYWWRQTEWHSKMDKSMQVNGMGESTREAYLRSMRQLVEHYDRTPDHITEDELLDYFIHRQNVTGWSPATMRICYSGVKFFFKHVLKRDWHLLTIAQARRERRLPAVLSRDEVRKIFSLVRPFHNYACLATVYSCGLRLQEGLYLEVSDIDGLRKMIHIHRGKGAKDRYVPLPESTYALLRRYWRTHRNPDSFSQPSAEADKMDRLPQSPCPSKAYKAPSGKQNTSPTLKRKASPSTPCATHMLLTCWEPVSTSASSKKISVIPTSKPP